VEREQPRGGAGRGEVGQIETRIKVIHLKSDVQVRKSSNERRRHRKGKKSSPSNHKDPDDIAPMVARTLPLEKRTWRGLSGQL